MRERPIIFNTENVRTILSGRKTQTRRVIKPQPPDSHTRRCACTGRTHFYRATDFTPDMFTVQWLYNQHDRLWVRETWKTYSTVIASAINYKADDTIIEKDYPFPKYDWPWILKHTNKWCSPFFMPRWASRLTLEILNIRIERLQEITMKDCLAEGFVGDITNGTPKGKFIKLWDSINLKRGFGWDKNPWIFVIEFKKL